MLNKDKILENLSDMGDKIPEIFLYELTDSTNTRAKAYASAYAENRSPKIFIAREQSAGRGRLGRSFVSNKDAGIYISFLTYPTDKGFVATKKTAEAAVALSRAIESVTGSTPRIKWVNDIYLGSKKLAGILTEGLMSTNGKISHLVLGMGINVYKKAVSEEIFDIATSLEDEFDVPPDINALAANIIREMLIEVPRLKEQKIYEEYRERSFIIGQRVNVIKPDGSYPARVLDLLDDYSLLIEREDGEREVLFTGEVSLRPVKR